jgi:hypothetical protein
MSCLIALIFTILFFIGLLSLPLGVLVWGFAFVIVVLYAIEERRSKTTTIQITIPGDNEVTPKKEKLKK